MVFNSIEFLILFVFVFIVYWTLKSNKFRNLFILLASYLFYSSWDYRFLSLIIISTLVDFIVGLKIGNSENASTKKLLLFLSMSVNLGFLLVFKYFNFFLDSFEQLASGVGLSINTFSLSIILPVGISFYTFQTMSYTIDVYKGVLKPTKDLLKFATFVSFFPQLVAGPIERATNLLPQFDKFKTFDYKSSIDGIRQILWGFFKKVVVADNCAIYVDYIFDNYTEQHPLILVLGAVLFAFQIYGDFSGYSDIAIGTARLLGFNLMQNFAMPYFSRDIAEFWRKWHISLSTWFRDYLYIPLGGSRVSNVKKLRNVLAIFLVSGFWHGANWTFIVWGALHVLFYLPLLYRKKNRKNLTQVQMKSLKSGIISVAEILKTFILVTLAWIFFRASSVSVAVDYISSIFNKSVLKVLDFSKLYEDIDISLTEVFIYVLIMLVIEWVNRDFSHGLYKLTKFTLARYLIYIVLTLLVIQYFYSSSAFIYFQF